MATKPDSPVSKTRPSSFDNLMIEANVGDYHARGGSSSSLVSSRTHASPEEEDTTDEGAEAEGGCGQEGKR
jgi:hypothetical protein